MCQEHGTKIYILLDGGFGLDGLPMIILHVKKRKTTTTKTLVEYYCILPFFFASLINDDAP